MSDLVIIAFPDEATAFEARAELMKLQKEYLIEMEDAVYRGDMYRFAAKANPQRESPTHRTPKTH